MVVHGVGNLADFLGWISRDDLSVRPEGACFQEGQCADNAPFTYLYIIHDDSIHADEALLAEPRSVNDRTMSNVCPFRQMDRGPRKHVDDDILLDIASPFHYNASPIAAEHGTRTDETIRSDGDMTDDNGIGVHESAGVHNRDHVLERLDHAASMFSMMVA